MVDYRRHIRPFFLDADLTTPTKYKKYYDFTCWLVIVSTYNYVVQPFITLTIWDSLRLWGRLYVYYLFDNLTLVLRPHRNSDLIDIFPQRWEEMVGFEVGEESEETG